MRDRASTTIQGRIKIVEEKGHTCNQSKCHTAHLLCFNGETYVFIAFERQAPPLGLEKELIIPHS